MIDTARQKICSTLTTTAFGFPNSKHIWGKETEDGISIAALDLARSGYATRLG